MTNRILATKTLLTALLAARSKRHTAPPPTMKSQREESSPFTLREGLFQEPKTMPGFARLRSKSQTSEL